MFTLRLTTLSRLFFTQYLVHLDHLYIMADHNPLRGPPSSNFRSAGKDIEGYVHDFGMQRPQRINSRKRVNPRKRRNLSTQVRRDPKGSWASSRAQELLGRCSAEPQIMVLVMEDEHRLVAFSLIVFQWSDFTSRVLRRPIPRLSTTLPQGMLL